uniref:SUI1 domain-containing protein n=1 Tax=Onchocerca ochengi TaxID=42157 RepID=A0A182DZL0_ONCOC
LRNPSSGLCLDTLQRDEKMDISLGVFSCQNGKSEAQLFSLTNDGKLRREITCAKIDRNSIVGNKAIVQLVYCGEDEKDDKWILKDGKLQNEDLDLCLDVMGLKNNDNIVARSCINDLDTQKWEILKNSVGMADDEGDAADAVSVKYPLQVQYCGVCSMPLEYCEYSGMTDKCLNWLETNLPSEFEKLNLGNWKESIDAEKKHQKRGGKGSKVVSEKQAAVKKNMTMKVTLQRVARGKNKFVTVIKGLASFGDIFNVDLKSTAKLFAGHFACGSSVTATDEIVVQGDVKDEILEIIGTKWPFIDSHLIEDLGDQKR